MKKLFRRFILLISVGLIGGCVTTAPTPPPCDMSVTPASTGYNNVPCNNPRPINYTI